MDTLGEYDHLFNPNADTMYYGMTATHGWEWFDPVRHEDRFKKYIEIARKLLDSTK